MSISIQMLYFQPQHVSKLEPELGTAQPQLVICIKHIFVEFSFQVYFSLIQLQSHKKEIFLQMAQTPKLNTHWSNLFVDILLFVAETQHKFRIPQNLVNPITYGGRFPLSHLQSFKLKLDGALVFIAVCGKSWSPIAFLNFGPSRVCAPAQRSGPPALCKFFGGKGGILKSCPRAPKRGYDFWGVGEDVWSWKSTSNIFPNLCQQISALSSLWPIHILKAIYKPWICNNLNLINYWLMNKHS